MVENIKRILDEIEKQDSEKYGPYARVVSRTVQSMESEGLLPAFLYTDTLNNARVEGENVFTNPHFTFDVDYMSVFRKGEDIARHLTPKETRLLHAFVLNPNIVIPRYRLWEILSRDWADDMGINQVHVYVNKLRKIIGYNGEDYTIPSQSPIDTVRGVGYKLKDEGGLPEKENEQIREGGISQNDTTDPISQECEQDFIYLNAHFSYDVQKKELLRKGSKEVRKISSNEALVLMKLIQNSNNIVEREEMMDELFKFSKSGEKVDKYVGKLRKLIGWQGQELYRESPIKIFHGSGFMLEDDKSSENGGPAGEKDQSTDSYTEKIIVDFTSENSQ